jgi:sialidase-1
MLFTYEQGSAAPSSALRVHDLSLPPSSGRLYAYATLEMGPQNPTPYHAGHATGTQKVTLGEQGERGFTPALSFGLADVFRGDRKTHAADTSAARAPSGGNSVPTQDAFLMPWTTDGVLDRFGPWARPGTAQDFKAQIDLAAGRVTLWTCGRGDDDWFLLADDVPLLNRVLVINRLRIEQCPGAQGVRDVCVQSQKWDEGEQVRPHPLAKQDRVVAAGKGFTFQAMRSTWGVPGRHVAVSRKPDFHHAFTDVAQSGPRSLVAVWSNRSHSGGTGGISVALSDDLGRTWREGPLVHAGKVDCPRLQRLQDGTLLILCDIMERPTFVDVILYESLDGGRTWGNPRLILAPEAASQGLGQPTRLVELPDGSWLVGTSGFGGSPWNVTAALHLEFWRSTDRGQTWQSHSRIDEFPPHHVDESSIVPLPDGRLAVFAREWRYDGLPGMKAFSADQGRTWKVQELPFCVTGRVCAGRLADGRVMITFRSGIGRAALWAWIGDPDDPTGFQAAGVHFNDRSSVGLKEGVLHLDNDGRRGQFTQYVLRPPDTADSVLEVTAEVMVVSNQGRAATLSVPYVGRWRLFPDHIELAHDPSLCVSVTPQEFHVVRIVRDGRQAKLYVDGHLALTTDKLDGRTWRETGLLNTSVHCLTFGNDAATGNAHTNIYAHDISPEVSGYSLWRRVEERLDDPRTGTKVFSWSAARDGFPDQYQLDHIVQIEASASGGDQGYSGWVQLEDGRIFVVNYTDDTAPMVMRDPYDSGLLGIPWIRGTFLLPADLREGPGFRC